MIRIRLAALVPLFFTVACSDSDDTSLAPPGTDPGPGDELPAEVTVGERAFRETRFAHVFYARSGGDANADALGDPRLADLGLGDTSVASPFAGTTFACASCHVSREAEGILGAGPRAFTNFAPRTALSERSDGFRLTARNVPTLVDVAAGGPRLYHADGEFASLEGAVRGALLGRKLGWLADEKPIAAAHLAYVLRNDDGTGTVAQEYGGVPWSALLDPSGAGVPDELLLPEELRIDVSAASDEELVDAVASLIVAYLETLSYTRDEEGRFAGSPYDVFLALNGLPRAPEAGVSPLDYGRRLAEAIEALDDPQFVGPDPDGFETHEQDFVFAERELAGLLTFLREPDAGATTSVGNCIACHAPPRFTDDGFHDVGVAQADYDAVHGVGAYVLFALPDLAERNAHPALNLPPSASRPSAPSRFRFRPLGGWTDLMDLGLWNVFANENMPQPQDGVRAALIETHGPGAAALSDAELLPLTVGLRRTPGLRDLGHTDPYGHHGGSATIEEAVEYYREASDLARVGALKNGDPRLEGIVLDKKDVETLAAFLRALNEDLPALLPDTTE